MSRWRRWWSLWSRSGMKMVKLRAWSSQHGQVFKQPFLYFHIFLQNMCHYSGFQTCWIFWEQPWMRTTSLMLHCTTGWKAKYFEQLWNWHLKFYSGATTQGNFKRNLQKFKNREDVKVWRIPKSLSLFQAAFCQVLLMPISRGANGLNLVEASHVLLVRESFSPKKYILWPTMISIKSIL